MATSSISSVMASTTSNAYAATTKSQAQIDNDDFMTLLLAQLKNQDPLSPLDSSEMMAQIAQLNSLNALLSIKESIETMTKSQDISYAASLIGKTITAMPDANDSTNIVKGVVSSMTNYDNKIALQVEGQDIELSSIVEVSGWVILYDE